MFACSTYLLTEEFEANITVEIEQNIRRIRHHACLGLWCGNNEMEGMIVEGYTTDTCTSAIIQECTAMSFRKS